MYFGLYICVGTKTCSGGRPGSYGHFEHDAATFKEWGMDFIKADNCTMDSRARRDRSMLVCCDVTITILTFPR